MKASELRPGMRITLDMGWGHPMDEVCTILTSDQGVDLFGDPCIKITVRRYNGERIEIANFNPNNEVDVHEELL